MDENGILLGQFRLVAFLFGLVGAGQFSDLLFQVMQHGGEIAVVGQFDGFHDVLESRLVPNSQLGDAISGHEQQVGLGVGQIGDGHVPFVIAEFLDAEMAVKHG